MDYSYFTIELLQKKLEQTELQFVLYNEMYQELKEKVEFSTYQVKKSEDENPSPQKKRDF